MTTSLSWLISGECQVNILGFAVLPFCRCFHQFVLVVAAFIAVFCLSRSVLQKNIGLVGRFKKMFHKNWTIRQHNLYYFSASRNVLVHSAGLVHSTLDMTREATCCPG